MAACTGFVWDPGVEVGDGRAEGCRPGFGGVERGGIGGEAVGWRRVWDKCVIDCGADKHVDSGGCEWEGRHVFRWVHKLVDHLSCGDGELIRQGAD